MITMTHDEHLWHLENVKRIAELEAERDALRAERDKITQLFLTHGRHHKDCLAMNSPISVNECDCGFDAVMILAEKEGE